jgi:hypothetical protein
MVPEDLRPSYRTRVNVRPLKVALFVAASSRKQLREAILDCCTMWGGITNLIVPVESNAAIQPFYRYLLELHQPDVAVSYMPSETDWGRRRHAKLRKLLDSVIRADVPLRGTQEGGFDLGSHPLNIELAP